MKVSDFTFESDDATPSVPVVFPVGGTAPDTEPLETMLARVCREFPERTAMVDTHGSLSFADFHAATGAVARFIAERGYPPETPVAVLCGRNRHCSIAALGILRSGAVYTPLDPSLPPQRLALLLKKSTAPLIITDSAHVDAAQRLQVRTPSVTHLLCLDAPHFEDALEKPSELMALELWDTVTASIADASWKSYVDGKPLPAEALQGMADNLMTKAGAALHPQSRVLDIGSGGGVVARALLNKCGHYTAMDLSQHDLNRLAALRPHSTATIETRHMEALDIGLLPRDADNLYDLICLNSVVESFPGFNYLRAVLHKAVEHLADDGTLFVGMVWDTETKDAYRQELLEYTRDKDRDNFNKLGRLAAFDAERELFIPRAFFEDWAAQSPTPLHVDITPTANPLHELSAYRYDVLIRKRPVGTVRSQPDAPCTRFGTAHLDYTPCAPCAAHTVPGQRAAYLIFTSGSTGVPGGVLVEHRSLLALVRNIDTALRVHVLPHWPDMTSRPWRCALLSSCASDASLQLLLLAPLYGHTLYWIDDETRKNPDALHHFLEKRHIDLTDGTPSLFQLLLSHWQDSGTFTTVRCFILGGELMRLDMLEQFYRLPGHARSRFFNAYGSTECCVNATLHPLDATSYARYGQTPLGEPLPMTRFQLCDAQGQPLPEGVPGELWISGEGVARGYLNDPEHTRMAFAEHGGQRWYRTGDLCRVQDGLYYFMGRVDQQVKVAGNRVELGDVEAALCAAPGVRQTAAQIKAAPDGVFSLEAWIVPEQMPTTAKEEAALCAALRGWLESRLPLYARPARYVFVSSLPMTPGGQIDRKSLPDAAPPSLQTDDVALSTALPLRTATEEQLADLWSEVLGRTIDDADSDFFDLGGHSVLAIRLLSRMEKAFGSRLPLAALFQHSTLSALAAEVDKLAVQEAYCPIIPLVPAPDKIPFFLFHPVGGSVFCYRELAEHLAQAAAVYAVEPPGFSVSTPHMYSVEDMAAMYLAEIIQRVEAADPEQGAGVVFGGWSFGGLLAYEAARQYRAMGGRVRNILLLDTETRLKPGALPQDEAAMLLRMFEGVIPLNPDAVHTLHGDARLDYLMEQGLAHNMLPSGFTRDHMRRLLLTYHYNALAGARYIPTPSAERAMLIRAGQVSASSGIVGDSVCLGWESVLHGGLSLRWMDASHESLLTPAHAPAVARHILEELEELEADEQETMGLTAPGGTTASPSRLRLFALPYGGGNAQVYRPLAACIDRHIELCTLELPGRGERSEAPLLTTLDALAEDLFVRLRTRMDGTPYALFGHSMGAALAWLCCLRLHKAGLPLPKALLLSSPPTPEDPAENSTKAPIHTLPGEALFRRLHDMGGFSDELLEHRDLMNYLEPMLRADMQAVETWRPTPEWPTLSVNATLVMGTEEYDPQVFEFWLPRLGRSIPVQTFAGGHFYLHTHWKEVGRVVNRMLRPLPHLILNRPVQPSADSHV